MGGVGKWVVGGLLASVTMAAGRQVDACSCAPGPRMVLPGDGMSGIPTNTRILVWNGGATELWGPSETIALEEILVVGDRPYGESFVVYAPAVELAAETMYTLLSNDEELARFTTGPGPDLEPPGPLTDVVFRPGVGEVDCADGDSCAPGSPFRYADVSADARETTGSFTMTLTHEGVAEAPLVIPLGLAKTLADLSTATCSGSGAPAWNEGEEWCLELAATDLAGNTATTSICTTVGGCEGDCKAAVERAGCSEPSWFCSVAAGRRPAGGLAVLIVAALAMARRARRHSAR